VAGQTGAGAGPHGGQQRRPVTPGGHHDRKAELGGTRDELHPGADRLRGQGEYYDVVPGAGRPAGEVVDTGDGGTDDEERVLRD
jgi:hypothetical protein